MSVYCSVAHTRLFLKALCAVSIHRDCWAAAAFTPHALLLRVEGSDLSSTATAELPRSLFGEYHVDGEVRFAVHVPNLIDAVLLLGPALLLSSATRVVLAYAAADAKLLVELSDAFAGAEGAGRTVQSTMITRPIPSQVLDLHFEDVGVVAEATIQSDTLRDIIVDLIASHCSHVVLTIDAQHGVQLLDEGGMYTSSCANSGNRKYNRVSSHSTSTARMSALLPLHCDALVALHTGQLERSDWVTQVKAARRDQWDDELRCNAQSDSAAVAPIAQSRSRNVSVARTCVSTRHLALACGVHAITSSGGNAFTMGMSRSTMRHGGAGGGGSGSSTSGMLTHALHDPFMSTMCVSSTTGGSLHAALSSFSATAAAAAALGSLPNAFELLTVQLNSRGQVSVVHTEQDKSMRVSVAVVISPLHMVE